LRGGVVGDLGFGAVGVVVGVAVGNGARCARARGLLVQGVRVDKGAVLGLGLGAIVEDPDNLGLSVWALGTVGGGQLTVIMDSRM
jgi:hypothetical protein